MIRSVPNDGIVALYLSSEEEKPLIYKNGSVVYETDTQDKYFFDEENKVWYKYTGPDLHFYLKTTDDVYCYFGLDSDTKPTDCGYGSVFVEMNSSKAYTFSEDGWKEAVNPGPTPPGPTPQPVLQDKTVDPTISEQEVTYDLDYDGLGTVTITAVTSDIDDNIKAENIKKDIAILGVTGTYEPVIPAPVLQDKNVTPAITEQIVHADEAYDGLNDVTVSAVTSSIDNNIQAANIKKDVTILGVVGTYEGEEPQPVPTTTAVDVTIFLIDELPDPQTVTENDRAKIHRAQDTYDALSNEEKVLVTNYPKLVACEAALPNIDLDFTDLTKVANMGIDINTHILFHDGDYDILLHCDKISAIDEGSGLKYNSGNYFEVFNNSKKNATITFTFVGNGTGKQFKYGDEDSDVVIFDRTPIEYTITLASNSHIQFTSGGGAYLSKFYCII